MRHTTSSLLLVLLVARPVALCAQQPATSDAQVRQLCQNGYAALKSHQPKEALDAFRSAAKLAQEPGSDCFQGMAIAYTQLGKMNDALDAGSKALSSAKDDDAKASAHVVRGKAALSLVPVDEKRLQLAEEEFRAAAQLKPKEAIYHCDVGLVLLREKKDAEGKQELTACIALHPSPQVEKTAHQILADPRRAREIFAPEFAFTSLQGEEISLKRLSGKVVVLDFWATWCPPCRASLPELKELTRKYPTESLALISVSADDDEAQWKDFVEKKSMTWPQYRDADHKVRSAFQVNSFPTYLVLDGAGIVKKRIVGMNPKETIVHQLKATLAAMPELEGVAGK